MTDCDILIPLKTDLDISVSARDDFLLALIGAARDYIAKEGINLSDTIGDANLVRMYAAYLYRSRKDGGQAMPRALRWALNNRLFSEKAAAEAEQDG